MRLTSAESLPTQTQTETCGLKQRQGYILKENAQMCKCENQKSNTSILGIEFQLILTNTETFLFT